MSPPVASVATGTNEARSILIMNVSLVLILKLESVRYGLPEALYVDPV